MKVLIEGDRYVHYVINIIECQLWVWVSMKCGRGTNNTFQYRTKRKAANKIMAPALESSVNITTTYSDEMCGICPWRILLLINPYWSLLRNTGSNTAEQYKMYRKTAALPCLNSYQSGAPLLFRRLWLSLVWEERFTIVVLIVVLINSSFLSSLHYIHLLEGEVLSLGFVKNHYIINFKWILCITL